MAYDSHPGPPGPPFVYFWFPSHGEYWCVNQTIPCQTWIDRDGILATVSLATISELISPVQWRRVEDSDPDSLLAFPKFKLDFNPPKAARDSIQRWLDGYAYCFYYAGAHHE